jgi:hypothetical protein
MIGMYFEYIAPSPTPLRMIIINISLNTFLVIEFVLFTNFILQVLLSRTRRIITRVLAGIFLLILLDAWALPHDHMFFFLKMISELFVLESLFLIIPCLFYFYELFKFPKLLPLKKDPNLWVVTGILFLSVASLPLFLVIVLLLKMNGNFELVYSLNYLLYILLFALLILASLCETPTE